MERRGDGREGADGQQRGRAVGQRGGAARSYKGAQTEGRGEGTAELGPGQQRERAQVGQQGGYRRGQSRDRGGRGRLQKGR